MNSLHYKVCTVQINQNDEKSLNKIDKKECVTKQVYKMVFANVRQ